ncbi:unnamed protein product [Phaedon cochleariae]|uniref:Rotatin N-terminal domain-containing protein n=1 Tax=Phaedon cochleariae TaxID=80249 RepID=A0A9P0DMJ9_PHACE|nr:unnamed protein product [Phaedon cochleariae]
MGDQYISSYHIEKLGHKLQEIRERSLFNIISKLENGICFDNDLARTKELITKLFKWFLFEPCTQEELVFALLKRILKSESGKTLINHLGKELITRELQQTRTYLEPKFLPLLDEISSLIEQDTEGIVPPLECEIPLSYRTSSTSNIGITPNFGTTATPIEGYVQKATSVEQQGGYNKNSDSLSVEDLSTYRIEDNVDCTSAFCLPNFYFDWQSLIEPDRHVLYSIEKSLLEPPQPVALLHACEFFANVLLHDFPAEIFLQRPSIILEFFNLMSCGSTRITNAVLNCLCDLTEALRMRIHHCNDISMRNCRKGCSSNSNLLTDCSLLSVNRGSDKQDVPSEIVEKFETPEDVEILLKKQLSTPKFCFMTADTVFKYLCVKPEILNDRKVKSNQVAINFCLVLLDKLIDLMRLCLGNKIWDEKQNEKTLSVLKDFTEIFVKYGMALEHFRLESMSCDNNIKYRVVYIYLLLNCTKLLSKLVPVDKAHIILPRNLKTALSNCLLDVTFGRLYQNAHNMILNYVQNFSLGEECNDYLKKYRDVKQICIGITSTVKFLKQYKNLSFTENLRLAVESLPSIEFHKDLDYLKIFVEVCSEKLPQTLNGTAKMSTVEEVVLSLLSHGVMEIREEMYRLCQRVVISNIGPKLNMSYSGVAGSQILFLLTSKILVEIATFGMTSDNLEIQRYAESILTYLLKSKILICETIWDRAVQALLPSLPIIACHATNNSILGKTLISLMDPDASKDACIPKISMLKCNIEFLFSEEVYLREEAFSRISWLISSQEKSREMLPRFNTLYDSSLSTVCRLKKVVDVNKSRRTEHFYQPSSLHQVLEVLVSKNVEPVIRRSALNQISVMMEDPLLHTIFLDANGLDIVVDILKSALIENDFTNYPDAVIPIVSILKNVCFYNGTAREELSLNEEVFFCVLRGLFLFFTEDRMKQDAATLLFILIFKDFVVGNPSMANFSLPHIVTEKMLVPFICATHWSVSDYTKESLKDKIVADRWCLSSIQIQWNAAIFGGFESLVHHEEINYESHSMLDFVDVLKLSKIDLRAIKASCIEFCVKHYLNNIQNGTCHDMVIDSIDHLTLYAHLYKVVKYFDDIQDDQCFLLQPWEKSFARFLKVLPSCEEDSLLLKKVIQFLSVLSTIYTTTEPDNWITLFLKDSGQSLLDLLSIDSTTDEESKIVGQEILKLITICVKKSQNYIDSYPPRSVKGKPWTHVIKMIAENLKFSETQHFYNLAYLDALLSCLVNLTATLGWSDSKKNTESKNLLTQMVSGLCELVGAFHSGKGPVAAISVMGLSITRHVLLVLNHLLAELQNEKVKGWETSFFDDTEGPNPLLSFVALWSSRDVILRAGALQLFSGLAVSPRVAIEIVNGLNMENPTIWELALTILVDHNEASIVRENAAQLLANLAGQAAPLHSEKSLGTSLPALKKSCSMTILNLVEDFDLYGNLEIIISSLFTLNLPEGSKQTKNTEKNNFVKYCSSSEKSWDSASESYENSTVLTTPGLIRSLANFLLNLFNLEPDRVSNKLQDLGIVKLLFRTLCTASMSISNTRELSLYCDILEMNTMVCSVLIRLASTNPICLGTILHTRDCLNLLFSLLNPRIYNIHLPQLMYLRNKLWCEIFTLISTLVEFCGESEGNLTARSVEIISIYAGTLLELGNEPFFETVCESISYLGSHDLQNSALTSLTCLLRIENYRVFEKTTSPEEGMFKVESLQSMLDSVRTSRSIVISDAKENVEPRKHRGKQSSARQLENYRMNVLEEAYFDKALARKSDSNEEIEVRIVDYNDGLVSGAEICKILLYLYDICDLEASDAQFNKQKSLVIAALSSLLSISRAAKRYAMESGLVSLVLKQLRQCHVRLSLESVDSLRRISGKKKCCPVLNRVDELVVLLNNFMLEDESVKVEAASANLADVVHKLWVWFSVQNGYLVNALKMVCTYTTDCGLACQTLPLTSPVAGSGPRKSPSTVSLLHTIITLINKQMDQISRTHDIRVLEISSNILQNACSSLECRVLISKSNLFQCLPRLHPAITKRQKPWENLELIWLDLLQTFTTHPEGQATVAKIPEVLDLIMALTSGARAQNRAAAMLVLRNVAFHQPNKARLLSSSDFLNILGTKLTSGCEEEKYIVVVIMWALSANSQKAKIILKSIHLDDKLENFLKHCQLFSNGRSEGIAEEKLRRMCYVLDMLRDKDKVR